MAVTTPVPHRRAIPKQARAAATLGRILDAAVEVLVERGLQGFNTNVVAEVAGVNVATLYHYFPDKNSVLRELFHRSEERRVGFVLGHLRSLATTGDVHQWVDELVGQLLAVRLNEPAGAVLRRAWRAVPELMAVEEERNHALVGAFATALGERYPQQSAERLEASARMLLIAAIAVLDLGSEQPERARGLADELVELVSRYLASLES